MNNNDRNLYQIDLNEIITVPQDITNDEMKFIRKYFDEVLKIDMEEDEVIENTANSPLELAYFITHFNRLSNTQHSSSI
jgi:hypothetical protein